MVTLSRWRERLARPGVIAWLPALGVLLATSAIGPYLVFDDYVLGLIARGEPKIAGLVRERNDLFSFTTGQPSLNRQLMERGFMLPWWSDQELKIAFFRPLSALLHRLDFALWPGSARAMYLHSLAWLGLVIAVAAHLYRRLESSAALAGLAALLFAVDDSHGAVVAWLSNRNALVASVFGLLSLLAHHAWRHEHRRAGAWLAPLAWLIALSAGEFAAGTLAYLASYALFLDRAPTLSKFRSLFPYALVALGWGAAYWLSGAAVHGSESYVSPWLDLPRFLRLAPLRLAALLAAALGPIPSELLLLGSPVHLTGWAALVGLLLAAAAYALWPVLRRDRVARFWLVGMLLSLVPVTASFPSDRLLLLASVGGMGLLARVVEPLFDARAGGELGKSRAALRVAFSGVHLLLGPLCLPLRAAQMQLVGETLEAATSYFDRVPALEQRTVVIVNAPLDALASYVQAERAWRRAPLAAHWYWLTTAGSSLSVSRTDESTLLVQRSEGFLSTALERHYRARENLLNRGDQIQLGPLTATIVSLTPDARPRAVSFRFAERLESSSYVFVTWKDGRYQPLSLHALTRPLVLPPEDLGEILAHTALGAR